MARALKPPSVKLPTKLPERVSSRLPKLPDPNQPDVFEEMTLLEHMEELRDRIVKICIAVGIAFVAGWFLSDAVLEFMKSQAGMAGGRGFQTLNPADPLTSSMKVAMYIAITITLPIIIYQIMAFLAPGLTNKEKRLVFLSLPFVSILFLSGVAFALFAAAPRALNFLSTFRSEVYDFQPTAENTINFYLALMLGLGLAFQLPVVMFLLAKLNILSAKRMASYRKYAFVIILVAAAIITPTVDPFNLLFVALPLYLLYEIGIVVSLMFAKRPAQPAAPTG